MTQFRRWTRATPVALLFVALALFTAALSPQAARAVANIVVNSSSDAVSDDGSCTLREAIIAANTDTASGALAGECAAGTAGVDEIGFAGNYTITLGSQLPVITTFVDIIGNGPDNTIIQADAAPDVADYRVLELDSATVTLEGLTIRHGRCGGNCENHTEDGGGIYAVTSSLTIIDSLIADNTVINGYGGGIYADFVELEITGTTLSGNQALFGAAIAQSAGLTLVVNSTVSGNTSLGDGGGFLNTGELVLNNTTVTGNHASNGGAIYASGGSHTTTMIRSVIAGNSADVAANEIYLDTFGSDTMNANAFNVFSHAGLTSADAFVDFAPGANDFNASSDAENVALTSILDTTLADNGGLTPTHALVEGSPAIDFASLTGCVPAPVNGVDQRGETRPMGAGCDSGSYEFPLASITVIKDAQPDDVAEFTFRLYTSDVLQQEFILDDDGDNSNALSNTKVLGVVGDLSYVVTESQPPDGWELSDVVCSSSNSARVEYPLIYDPITFGFGPAFEDVLPGEDITCTFINTVVAPDSYCPTDDERVGYLMTDMLGTGQGSATKGFRTRKLVIPNYDDVASLYGQLAAVDLGIMKFVRFLPQGEPKVQIHAPTSPSNLQHGVAWWGADLPTDVQWVKGQFFWGPRGNRSPRAFVLWPTYETQERYYNEFITFDEFDFRTVADAPGWPAGIGLNTVIPETQQDGATIEVRFAVVDNDKDNRPVIATVAIRNDGGVVDSLVYNDTQFNAKATLNLYTAVFEDVPAGVNEVTLQLEAPAGGDSASVIGMAINYACGDEEEEPLYTLGGRVWYDINGNGLQDAEAGVPFAVGVNLYDNATCAGGSIASTSTNISAEYEFAGLAAGDYCVAFGPLPPDVFPTTQNVGGDDAIDSDADGSARVMNINLTADIDTIDMGVVEGICRSGDGSQTHGGNVC